MTNLRFVMFSPVPWSFLSQRSQQISIVLSKRGHTVFFVQPQSLKMLLREFPIQKLSNSLYLISFFMMLYSKRLNTINEIFVYPTILRMFLQKIKPQVAILFWPYFSFIVPYLKKRGTKIVYDCADDFSCFPSAKILRITEKERELISESDLVVATSRRLQEKIRRTRHTAVLIPNAVDYKHFTKVAVIPGDISNVRHPIIGYFGGIFDWFDEKLVCALAVKRPDWSFVLIGLSAKEKEFQNLPNIFLLGRKPYDDIPSYLQQFDVCIIPFKVNELTLSVNPLKVYEYLAGGKPIVSTDLPELRHIPFVKIARNTTEFIRKIEEALEESEKTELIKARKEYASQNTWYHRVNELLNNIERILVPSGKRNN